MLHPPEETLPIPDLRTVGSEPLERPSAELFEIVRQVLGVPAVPTKGPWEKYTRQLIQYIEKLDVLVMCSGIVGNNTHRPLSVHEFRGFAISDRTAPVIFINVADAPQARLFTLIHELAHIWLGISGVSDGNHNSHRQEEKVCNAVAAEFLVSTDVFLPLWDANLDSWHDNLALIAARFHVSQWVIARKALDNQLISARQYGQYTKEILDKYKNQKSGPRDYYQGLKGKISERFSVAVLAETLSGRTLYRDAGRLLGIKPAKVTQYAKELGF